MFRNRRTNTVYKMLRLFFQTVITVGIGLAVFTPDAHPFDGDRRGFVLGFGMGLGTMSSPDQDVATPIGFQTDLTIGTGISDKVELHYTGKQFWYSEDDGFFSLANLLFGLSYYEKPKAPSAFLSAGVGLSLGVAFWRSGGALLGGPCFHVGTGYEFAPHWSVKFDVVTSRLSATDWNPWNFILSVNVLGY